MLGSSAGRLRPVASAWAARGVCRGLRAAARRLDGLERSLWFEALDLEAIVAKLGARVRALPEVTASSVCLFVNENLSVCLCSLDCICYPVILDVLLELLF